MKKLHIAPVAPSAIMAIGIFLIGSIERFPRLDRNIGPWIAAVVIMIWLYMYSLLILQMIDKTFRQSLFSGAPINFFAVGTWIAAVSVLCNLSLKYYPGLHPLIRIAALINISCWAIFAFFAAIKLYKIIREKSKDAHGIILLSAVATQSAIIMSRASFVNIPNWTIYTWITFGFLFYVTGIIILLLRYIKWHNNWNLITDWKNTNCIIHGALSISGVAMAVTGLFPSAAVITCWLIALFLLIFIESIEIIRAYKRVCKFGVKKGLFVFDTSQWARNFTFGMFFLLSRHILVRLPNTVPVTVISMLEQFLKVWADVVILFLLIEISIALLSTFQKNRQKKQKAEPSF